MKTYKTITIESEKAPKQSALIHPAEQVSFPLSEEDKACIEALKAQLIENEGVGLAAPQLNVRKSIAGIYIPENAALLRDNAQTHPLTIIINAAYSPIEEDGKYDDFEGCFSVESVYGKVPRYKSIHVTYQDEDGNTIETTKHEFHARVFQHEIDHLHGILITDRLTPDCTQGTFKEMLALRRAELPKEKQKLFDELIKQKGMDNE